MNKLSRRFVAVGRAGGDRRHRGIKLAGASHPEHRDFEGARASTHPTDPHFIQQNGQREALGALLATFGVTDGYVVENDFQPGRTTGWHSHPGPSLIFVVTGSVTNYESDQPYCKGVTYAAGTTFVDSGGKDVHELVNNGTTAAETIAVQFIPQGQPRRIDEPEPSNCHI